MEAEKARFGMLDGGSLVPTSFLCHGCCMFKGEGRGGESKMGRGRGLGLVRVQKGRGAREKVEERGSGRRRWLRLPEREGGSWRKEMELMGGPCLTKRRREGTGWAGLGREKGRRVGMGREELGRN